MKLKIRGTGDGATLDIIEPGQGSGVEDTLVTSIDVAAGKELNLNLPTAVVIEQIEYGDVVDTPAPTPEGAADQPGGGEEGSPADGGTPASEGEPAGGEPTSGPEPPAADPATDTPTDTGGGAVNGEPGPTTSAASEKPLYKVEGDTIPEGFVASGLETPGDETLYHFNGDTEGQAATGNVDGVSVYADADDNEKPVQAATPADAAPTA